MLFQFNNFNSNTSNPPTQLDSHQLKHLQSNTRSNNSFNQFSQMPYNKKKKKFAKLTAAQIFQILLVIIRYFTLLDVESVFAIITKQNMYLANRSIAHRAFFVQSVNQRPEDMIVLSLQFSLPYTAQPSSAVLSYLRFLGLLETVQIADKVAQKDIDRFEKDKFNKKLV